MNPQELADMEQFEKNNKELQKIGDMTNRLLLKSFKNLGSNKDPLNEDSSCIAEMKQLIERQEELCQQQEEILARNDPQ